MVVARNSEKFPAKPVLVPSINSVKNGTNKGRSIKIKNILTSLLLKTDLNIALNSVIVIS